MVKLTDQGIQQWLLGDGEGKFNGCKFTIIHDKKYSRDLL